MSFLRRISLNKILFYCSKLMWNFKDGDILKIYDVIEIIIICLWK